MYTNMYRNMYTIFVYISVHLVEFRLLLNMLYLSIIYCRKNVNIHKYIE